MEYKHDSEETVGELEIVAQSLRNQKKGLGWRDIRIRKGMGHEKIMSVDLGGGYWDR